MDAGLVDRGDGHTRARDAQAGVAVDQRGHLRRDAVVGHRAGAAGADGKTPAAGDGHRAGQDEGVDRLLTRGRDRDGAGGIDAAVVRRGADLQRQLIDVEQLPQVGVAVVLLQGRDLAPFADLAPLRGVGVVLRRQRGAGRDHERACADILEELLVAVAKHTVTGHHLVRRAVGVEVVADGREVLGAQRIAGRQHQIRLADELEDAVLHNAVDQHAGGLDTLAGFHFVADRGFRCQVVVAPLGVLHVEREIVAEVLVDVAATGAAVHPHDVAFGQPQHIGRRIHRGRKIAFIGIQPRADQVARQRQADRRTDATGRRTGADADRRSHDDGVDRRFVLGADGDSARALHVAVGNVGVHAAVDAVLCQGAGAADADADNAGGADGDRRRKGHRVDGGGVVRGHRDVARRGVDVGAADVGADAAVDAVCRQREADRDPDAHRATHAHGHRNRASEGADQRGVVGGHAHAVGRHRGVARALDAAAHIDADAVFREHTRAAGTNADGAGGADRYRTRHHQRADGLVGQRDQRQVATGRHRRVLELGPHLQRRGFEVARLPADEVACHGHADGRTHAHGAAGTHRGRDGQHRGRDGRGVLRAQCHVIGAVDHTAQAIGMGAAQDDVLRHRPGAGKADAQAANAGTDGHRGRHRDRIDGVARNAQFERGAHCADSFEQIALAVGRNDLPALALRDDRQPQVVDQQPVGRVVGRRREVDVD